MRPCPHCAPYGGEPGLVPVVIRRTSEDLALPTAPRPFQRVIWVPCRHCHGSVASCCDGVGNAEEV